MKNLLCCMVALFITSGIFAQGVRIGSSLGSPDNSSMLDIDSNNKGLLTPRMTTVERDAIMNPANGLLIYNTDTNCFNYHAGFQWMEMCGSCSPQPTVSNAGTDQLNLVGTTAILSANTPNSGSGSWSILSGSGGNFSSVSNPAATFTGNAGASYVLQWTISNSCGSSQDNLNVTFASAYVPGSQTFSVPGTSTFTVPAGITSVAIECWGAKGQNDNAGNGGYAKGTLTTTPGTILYTYVGGRNGANGGGTGASGNNGGGASDVRLGGTTLNDRIIVAGGGGGGWGGNYGVGGAGGGGNSCADGAGGGGGIDCGGPCSPYTGPGMPGTCSSGGTAGYSNGGFTGGAGGGGLTSGGAGSNNGGYGTLGGNGTLGTGGNGGTNGACSGTSTSGGGGGGYYGGGGSTQGQCYSGGAGGGSSWASSTLSGRTFSGGVHTTDGVITITW